MSYATANQLLQRFTANEIAQRTDRGEARLVGPQLMIDAAAGNSLAGYTVDQRAAAALAIAIVLRALADADHAIDAHIGGRYPLPIAPVPEILERVACDLARFYLYDDQVTDTIQKRYDEAMKLLRDVRDGKSQLGPDGATGVEPKSNAGAQLVSGDRVWRRGDSRGFL